MKQKTLRLNAVIGYPITHSKSPALHNPVYRALGLDAILLPFGNTDVSKLISAIRTLPIHLTAVTMPHKGSVMGFLDHIDPIAKKVNAVNTILNKNGVLTGYNTDVVGIAYALRRCKLKNKNVLLIGAGGAGRAVAYVVAKEGGNLMYLNRDPEEALRLKKMFGGRLVSRKELTPERIDVIINATPVGMKPKTSGIPIAPVLITSRHTVFDLVYNPIETRLLKTAKAKGAIPISGLDMFVVQGLRQIELSTRKKIISPPLVDRIKKSLIKK